MAVAPDVLMRRMQVRRLVQAAVRSGRAGRVGTAATALAIVAAATGFLSITGLVVTIGGTLGVAWLTFPRHRLETTWMLVEAALADAADPRELVPLFRRLARIHRLDGPRGLERAAATVDDPFVLATLGKLFPAFGLIGTLIGLALLLRNLGGADVSAIGPGLAMAVLTTLYGAILSNVVVLPLATRLQAHLAREAQRRLVIIEGVLLVARQEFPTRIERVLHATLGSFPGARPADVARVAGRAA